MTRKETDISEFVNDGAGGKVINPRLVKLKYEKRHPMSPTKIEEATSRFPQAEGTDRRHTSPIPGADDQWGATGDDPSWDDDLATNY